MKKFLIAATLLALAGAARTQAGVSVDISFGDGGFYRAQPRYEAVVPCPTPGPVYVPAPVYVPPVAVCAPAPVYVVPRPRYEYRPYGHFDGRYRQAERSRWDRRELARNDRHDGYRR